LGDFADYPALRNNTYIEFFTPLLNSVRNYAEANDISGSNIAFTGHSLGGGAVNQLATRPDIAGSFSGTSTFFGEASPLIADRVNVFNFGLDNDRVVAVLPLTGARTNEQFPTLTDYVLPVFDDTDQFAGAESVDPRHFQPTYAEVFERVTESGFYDETTRDDFIAVMMSETRAIDGDDVLARVDAPDRLFLVGNELENRINVASVNGFYDGGAATDVAAFDGRQDQHDIVERADGTVEIAAVDGPNAGTTVELFDIESALFDDGGVSLAPQTEFVVNDLTAAPGTRIEEIHEIFEYGDSTSPTQVQWYVIHDSDPLSGSFFFDDKLIPPTSKVLIADFELGVSEEERTRERYWFFPDESAENGWGERRAFTDIDYQTAESDGTETLSVNLHDRERGWQAGWSEATLTRAEEAGPEEGGAEMSYQLADTVWNVTGVDRAGTSWEGSTLVFTEQEDTEDGAELIGYFEWEGSSGSYGRENFEGDIDGAGKIELSGVSLEDSYRIVLGDYEATLAEGGTAITAGSWAGGGGIPGTWEAALVSGELPAGDGGGQLSLAGTTWDVTGEDVDGNTFEGSSLVFTEQTEEAGASNVAGYFDWVASEGSFGRVVFEGEVTAAGSVRLEGLRTEEPTSGIVPAEYYTAELGEDGTAMTGNWGGSGVINGSFEAALIEDMMIA